MTSPTRKLILLFLHLFCFLLVVAGVNHPVSLDSVVANFRKQIKILPQEKIYIHTDKPYYITGEKLFFRVHLTDATYHIPVSVSRYVYVELINPFDSVVARLKVRPDQGVYYGNLFLKEDLPDGAYQLRSYTNFMRNIDEAYYFSKTVYIANPAGVSLQTATRFEFEGSKVFMEIQLKEPRTNTFTPPGEIKIAVNSGKFQSIKRREQVYQLSFDLDNTDKQRVVLIEAVSGGHLLKKFIPVPYPENLYHVSFFPEGGHLLSGTIGNVAFKAVKSNGMSEEVTGRIIDNNGHEVTTFASAHLGMGSFNLSPQKGQKYYAECTNRDNVEMKFELPEVTGSGFTLKTNWVRGKLWVSILKPSGAAPQQLYLLMHCRGQLLHAAAWNNGDQPVFFDQTEFPAGILHLILLDKELNPISERLVFVNNQDQATIDFKTDKPAYGRRDHITSQIVVSNNQEPLSGNFSVSVTDDNEIITDSCHNILTNLLLTSELRGNIENPAGYFDLNDKKAGFKLDLLMMTQGWRRYDIPGLLAGKMIYPIFSVETGQRISGKVQSGVLLKETEKAGVTIVSVNKDYMDQTETDKHGQFVFKNFELPDSTQLLVRTVSAKGNERMVLTINKESFPEVKPWLYPVVNFKEDILKKYIQKEEQRYTYEHGIRLVNLEEVTVNARRLPETRSSYTSYADQSLTSEQIGKAGGLTTLKLISRMPGVEVNAQDVISIRGKSPVLLLVNDIETDPEYIGDIEAGDVLRIDLIQATSTFGQKSAHGIISISTKSMEGIAEKKRFNMAHITPLGYHQPVAFYSPVYDTQEAKENPAPDLRTTIYWNPNVVVENGNASFDFYAADQASVYSVIIEGVLSDGKIIHYSGKLIRE
ncbi:MAG: hypothetical protein LLG05_17265 [Porphyromonadaceae bacterium]|nr:hypothetical protein [Porphyromonadaceae bacterium]